jgi:hypothetical protein
MASDNDPSPSDNDIAELPVRTVAIASLTPGPYLRQGGTNAVHVQLLADAAGSADLPPVLVQQDGARVIDGMHRVEAAIARGEQTISARFIACTDAEALVLAIKSNTLHGLPLSKADRVAGAKRILAAHPDWSDRSIAGIAGLSPKTIGSIRGRLAGGAQRDDKRLGRDGRRRPVAAEEGRKRAAEYISSHPDAPLREVARETDVSLGTVHDVCTRIRRGADLVPGRASSRIDRGSRGARSERGARPERAARAQAAAWSEIAAKLAQDPAVRYTEGGKLFLRWMALHAAGADEWRELIDAIPVHWLGVIAPIADGVSEEWSRFAEQLRRRHEIAS